MSLHPLSQKYVLTIPKVPYIRLLVPFAQHLLTQGKSRRCERKQRYRMSVTPTSARRGVTNDIDSWFGGHGDEDYNSILSSESDTDAKERMDGTEVRGRGCRGKFGGVEKGSWG